MRFFAFLISFIFFYFISLRFNLFGLFGLIVSSSRFKVVFLFLFLTCYFIQNFNLYFK